MIQMLISSRNTLTDTPRVMLDSRPGHAVAQSSGHIKSTVTNSYSVLDARSKATSETNFQSLPRRGIPRETFRALLE